MIPLTEETLKYVGKEGGYLRVRKRSQLVRIPNPWFMVRYRDGKHERIKTIHYPEQSEFLSIVEYDNYLYWIKRKHEKE